MEVRIHLNDTILLLQNDALSLSNAQASFTVSGVQSLINLRDSIDFYLTEKAQVGHEGNQRAEYDLKEAIAEMLRNLGVPRHLVGYQYLFDAIHILVTSGSFLSFKLTSIYEQVAEMHTSAGPRVERGIRHTIKVTWKHSDNEVIKHMFGATVTTNKKPTNSQFIAALVDELSRRITTQGGLRAVLPSDSG